MKTVAAGPKLDEFDPLLQRARLGDAQAFGKVYERYALPIHRFFCRRLHDPEVAADLTADVFVRVHQAIQNGRPWHESFVSWLYQIARHRLIDHIRMVARRPQCELTDALLGTDSEQLDETIDRQLMFREVDAALQCIRPEYARILRLRYQADLSHAESGALLQRNGSAVKVTHHRAIKALRQQLVGNPVVESWCRMTGRPTPA
jgi:RNA polymerase sigma-70 factor (ECF subfamily)